MNIRYWVILCLTAYLGFAHSEKQESQSSPRQHPPGRVSAGDTNRVEPLSSPLKLTMTANDVLTQFGTPQSDYRFYGGGVTYPDFRILFSATGKEIESLVIRNRIRLACGLGVGDSMDTVRQCFPHGKTVYEAFQVETGQYALTFAAYDGRISEIKIRPSQGKFFDPNPAKSKPPARFGPTFKSLAGRWLDPKNGQSLELFPDGSYRTGVGGSGKFTIQGDDLVFTGVLTAWNQGKASLTQPDVFEFYWTNSEGFKNYFAFIHSPP